MRIFPEDEYDKEEAEKLNAEPWQMDLLKLNPSYVFWGPHEDYMSKDSRGWDSRVICESWEDFGPWGLDELNELVNFYFSVLRESKDCESCDGSGLTPEAKIISEDWYGFERPHAKWNHNITQDEADALWEKNRLKADFKEKPTAEQVNEWSRKGFGHDSINHWICTEARVRRLGYKYRCPECGGDGYIYTADKAHVSLTLWMLYPTKGCSRGVEITKVKQEDLDFIFKYLNEAKDRNAQRFSKI